MNNHQFAFFPGDPGEDEDEFIENWAPDEEPSAVEMDRWCSKIVQTKVQVKVENEPEEDGQLSGRSARSKRAPSVASSKRPHSRKIKLGGLNKDLMSETRSKFETGSILDKKENFNNINNTSISTSQYGFQKTQQLTANQVPLDVPPPRDIPDEEKFLRDRKDKQLKVLELERKEQREKEERERQRMKSKMDAAAEIEKHEHTYDDNGNVIFVKRPNMIKLQTIQEQKMEFSIHSMQHTQSSVQLKEKANIRIKSAKVEIRKRKEEPQVNKVSTHKLQEIELEKKAKIELEENYDKIFEEQLDSIKDYEVQLEALQIGPGIIMKDKEGKRVAGPPLYRGNKMTLDEYQRISQEFELQGDKVASPKQQNDDGKKMVISNIEEDLEASEIITGLRRVGSPERVLRRDGAESIYDKEITVTQHKLLMKAKRKDLKSATARGAYDQVIQKHNRIQSAQAQDIRIRKQLTKNPLKEKVYNYENFIGGVDMGPTSGSIMGSVDASARPLSSVASRAKLQSKNTQPVSINDEFNKKLLERGADRGVPENELPPVVRKIMSNQNHRPMTGKPQVKHQLQPNQKPAQINLESSRVDFKSGVQTDALPSAKNANKKLPRERIISAKLPDKKEKLPPPPFGKTMGHGLIEK